MEGSLSFYSVILSEKKLESRTRLGLYGTRLSAVEAVIKDMEAKDIVMLELFSKISTEEKLAEIYTELISWRRNSRKILKTQDTCLSYQGGSYKIEKMGDGTKS